MGKKKVKRLNEKQKHYLTPIAAASFATANADLFPELFKLKENVMEEKTEFKVESKTAQTDWRHNPRTTINFKQSHRLVEFIKNNYTARGVGDEEFTAIASQALGIKLTLGMLRKRRDMLGIKSTRDVTYERLAAERAAAKAALEERREAARKERERKKEEQNARARMHEENKKKQLELGFDPQNPSTNTRTNYPLPTATILERVGNLERLVVALMAKLEEVGMKNNNNVELMKLRVFEQDDFPKPGLSD